MTITLSLLFGAVIGVLLGLLGGGGSILAVPVLVYALGLDVAQAIPVSLIVIAVASAVGALPKMRANRVQWRLAGIFAAAGIRMLRDNGDTGTACRVGKEGINWRRCAPRSIPAGIVVGFLTGLFGVGGGFLIIPALVLMLGVEMPIAVQTSLLIITANSAGAVLSHLHGAHIDWGIATAFVGTAIVGSLVAGHLGNKVNTSRLQHWFAYLVFAVAAYVLIDTLLLH